MCRCTPEIKTPFCGKPGCEWPEQKPRALATEFPNGTRHDETSLAEFRKSGEELVQRSREIATVVRVSLLIISPSARKDAAAEILPHIQAQADIYNRLAGWLREVS